MKHLCFKGSLIGLLFFTLKVFALNVAFYYEKDIPEELLKVYDRVVIDPDYVDKEVVEKYKDKLFAYISIGEIENFRNLKYESSWIIGKNKNWNSKVTDIRNKDYQNFLLNRIENIRKDGIKNFFFDTLDSYQFALNKKEWKEYENALANFIIKVKQKYPDSKIILNRGFEVFDKVYRYIDAVVAESLFYGYDGKKYFEIKEEDRKWLVNKLNYIKSKNIPVIVIDYLPINEREKAREIAEKIKSFGFIPYITNKNHSIIGVSNLEIFPRKVLIIYWSNYDKTYSKEESVAHRFIQMPLEYFGYTPELVTPDEAVNIRYTKDRYAGIVVWLEKDVLDNYERFYRWILERIKNGNKVLFIDYFGFPLTQEYLKPLGINVNQNISSIFDKPKVLYKDKIVGFEVDIPKMLPDTLLTVDNGKPLLILENSNSQKFHPVSITKWGGYVLKNYSITEAIGIDKWIINPFEILKQSLRLKEFPRPDFTTENGSRVLFSHIDGDGSVSLSEVYPGKFAMEVIRDEVLKKYKIPIGVSFIEGEIMPYGTYKNIDHKKAIEVAKSIYALENVEPASHTFSHPFKWKGIYKLSEENEEIPEGYNLKIPGYNFSLEREIVGSCKNLSKLCPPEKKVNIIYWSGDCNPPEEALKIAYENNILNINNGDTYIVKSSPFLSLIAPAGIKKGKYWQIYDGEQNEYVYTAGFSRDFWKYKKVIETFELTDKPRRLKPIDIYYHFYSGVKLASLNAVKDVYNWALKQDVIPLKVSDYILKVLDFYNTAVAKEKDYWLVKTDKNLRTLRVDKNMGYPDLKESKGVVGFYEYNNQLYMSLDGSGDYKIKFTDKRPALPYIEQSNARIKSADINKRYFHLIGYVPVKVKLKNIDNCRVITDKKFKKEKNTLIFKEKKVVFKLECR
jgi:hypothetical protein